MYCLYLIVVPCTHSICQLPKSYQAFRTDRPTVELVEKQVESLFSIIDMGFVCGWSRALDALHFSIEDLIYGHIVRSDLRAVTRCCESLVSAYVSFFTTVLTTLRPIRLRLALGSDWS